MKRAKKREPYASKITDDERYELIDRVNRRDATTEDVGALLLDWDRAQEKQKAALRQKAGLAAWSSGPERFKNPDMSEASAQASVGVMASAIWDLAFAGGKARSGHKKAGLGRHSAQNDPETAERHRKWRGARDAIVAEYLHRGEKPPKAGELARLVCQRVPDAKWETVRAFLRRDQKQERRDPKQGPRILPNDYSQLMG